MESEFRAEWFKAAKIRRASAWRGVEAQHIISTMKLVDSAQEQAVLELLLEKSKPPLPKHTGESDFLLTTPFRYISRWPSRFRKLGESGVWYGAAEVSTVLAETGYWRWRFLMDSDGLKERSTQIQLTVFRANISGRCLDVTAGPWVALQPLLMHKSDYSTCHRVADECHQQHIAWLQYASVRDPQNGLCMAVFEVSALTPHRRVAVQTWAAKIQANNVFFNHHGESLQFDPHQW